MKTLIFRLLFAATILFSATDVQAEDSAPVHKDTDGPYLVTVRSFHGEGAATRARSFSDKLKAKHGVRSYVYDYDPARPGTSVAVYAGAAKTPKDAELLVERIKALKLDLMSQATGATLEEALITKPARLRAEAERDNGMTVKPQRGATGELLASQQRLAAIIAEADPVPPDRLRRFDWMAKTMHTTITGWNATIVSTVPDKNGTEVKLEIWPRHGGGFCAKDGYVFETYRVSEAGVTYIKSEGPTGPGVIIF